MKVGDKVIISPDLTHTDEWTAGTVIEVEDNPFVGIVISAETPDGNVFFGREELFKPQKNVISDFFARQVKQEIDRLWQSGELNEEKVESFRHLHERTPYKQ